MKLLTSFCAVPQPRSHWPPPGVRADQMEPARRLSGRQSAHAKISSRSPTTSKAATGGKLKITVHPNASLFKAPEIKRAVQTGQAQMGEILLSIHENEDALYGIDVVPFLATSFPDAMKLYKASKPAIEKKLAAQGIMLLFAVPWAPQGIYAKKDLNTIDDMKGLKWRAYNVGTARIGELVGAQR